MVPSGLRQRISTSAPRSWPERMSTTGWKYGPVKDAETNVHIQVPGLAAALADSRMDIFVKVRSTRPPAAAWLRAGNAGYEVELAGGEDGVSPGQACVFYDAGEGQARVLGGGFIASAVSVADHAARREDLTVRA